MWDQAPPVSKIKVPLETLRSSGAPSEFDPLNTEPEKPAKASPFPKPPSTFTTPCSIYPSEINATRPPPPAPPALERNLAPGSLLSLPALSPPKASIIPSFLMFAPTNLIAPPDPEPPEKYAPWLGLTKTVPPFIEIRTPD